MAEKNGIDPDQAQCPSPAEGERPRLEWYQRSPKDSVVTGLWVAAALAVVMTVALWGFAWVGLWYMWLILLAQPVFFYFRGRQPGFSAGADWFARSDKSRVRTYELAEVKVSGTMGSGDLEMRDEHGGYVLLSLLEIQYNRDLWDLVYNGIVHSVASGAGANARTMSKLHLD
ncbi:hypothetical protein IQ251_19050 [Saccharopolyspora sp. HNM0983]|uniref:DUF2244 domain-containing protein n=1 Tax=Saccharopolyspora montiporae TaxID=2781240 RepID=A0A929G357_9PSEU|nr:hypothetical protein [Saccharopolyspora sp. HNM0983]MBE9376553.1 hypothetical protein [Saccharopolyspora sp. HNM0983]